ncbi:hypothetical protein Sango_2878300 [Sesamum angolense]|uniref:Integrase zinc-binding domain-containing protein n=1 Tax=Sesamum angolense TaxID=2727404 RepID=A0AAE1T6J3_9LAMI|nr:hypothetical protein Sango_2878300 [Sesamum angolense]
MDADYLKLVEQVKSGLIRKYWLDNGLLYAKDGQVFVPMGTLRRRLLRETHDLQWDGHPGIDRMVALLARRYYWPRMEEDVEAYVRTCLVCQLDKVERKEEAGLLQPLSIPEVPWQSVLMDFISGFLKVNGMAFVLAVVDHFFKYGIFIAAPHACPAETAAELLFKNVTKYFGVPKDILPMVAQRRMKKYADMRRRHVELSAGDQDLLDTARQQTQRAPSVIQKEFEKTVLKILDHRMMGQRRGIVSAWSDIVMDSQTDGRSGCQVQCAWGQRTAGRRAWQMSYVAPGSSALELDSSAQGLLMRAVTLGRLQMVSEGLSDGRQLPGNCCPLSIDQTGWLTRPSS